MNEQQLHQLDDLLRKRFAIGLAGLTDDGIQAEDRSTIGTVDTFPYAVSDLLDPVTLRHILAFQSQQLGDVTLNVAGTMFAKRYSVLIAGMFAAYTLYDFPISADPSDIRIRPRQGGMMAYRVQAEWPRPDRTDSVDLRGHSSNRKAHFAAYAQRIDDHLAAVFEAVNRAAGAHKQVLHSLVVHQVHMMYARLEAEAAQREFQPADRMNRIEDDYRALNERNNTGFRATFRRIEGGPSDPPLLMRRYCCQAYRTSIGGKPHGYCESCPKTAGR